MNTQAETKKDKRMTFDVPEWMHRAAKIKAAESGKTVQQCMTELIEQWLQEDKPATK